MRSAHILRNLRLQLKSGFIKSEPAAYTFMKRYPPMNRDTAPPVEAIKNHTIPYLDLYEKEVERNPLYADEAVYGAYWQQEPQALTLAKKQFEYMEQGMSEEDAHDKALDYINEMESKSYEQMRALHDALKARGASLPILSADNVAAEFTMWRQKLSSVSYIELSDEEQGSPWNCV